MDIFKLYGAVVFADWIKYFNIVWIFEINYSYIYMLKHAGFITEAIPSSVNKKPQLMKEYLQLIKPGGVYCIPEIKKTDIIILAIHGSYKYENGIKDNTFTLTYDTELKLYKLFYKIIDIGSQYHSPSTTYGFIGIIQTIPFPLEYVKNIFNEMFQHFNYREMNADIRIHLVQQIFIVFNLIIKLKKKSNKTKRLKP